MPRPGHVLMAPQGTRSIKENENAPPEGGESKNTRDSSRLFWRLFSVPEMNSFFGGQLNVTESTRCIRDSLNRVYDDARKCENDFEPFYSDTRWMRKLLKNSL